MAIQRAALSPLLPAQQRLHTHHRSEVEQTRELERAEAL